MLFTFAEIVGNLDLPLDEALSGIEREHYSHILADDCNRVRLFVKCKPCKKLILKCLKIVSIDEKKTP